MENTLSDVNFGEDSSVLGAIIVAGAALGGIVAGWFISRVCLNKKFDERIARLEGHGARVPLEVEQVKVAPAKA